MACYGVHLARVVSLATRGPTLGEHRHLYHKSQHERIVTRGDIDATDRIRRADDHMSNTALLKASLPTGTIFSRFFC